MKKIFTCLVPSVLLLIAGCSTKYTPTPVILPSGTFSGPFVVIHLNSQTNKKDTTSANIVLTMSATTGYAVTGDTTTLQAGSRGSYIADGQYIQFIDLTLPSGTTTVKTSPSGKNHLNGVYQYLYDGTNFQLFASSADTIGYNYMLKAK